MRLLIDAFIFWAGIVVGYVGYSFLWSKRKHISGTIIVDSNTHPDKTIYSLEIDDSLEALAFKNVVIFKVRTSPRKS